MPLPTRPEPEVVEEVYTPPAEYFRRAVGDDEMSAAVSDERPVVLTSAPAAASEPASSERVLSTASLTPPSVESSSQAGSNGVPNASSNGASNGSSNDASNGSSNGVSNGSSNGGSNGATNGSKNGITNGASPSPVAEAEPLPTRAASLPVVESQNVKPIVADAPLPTIAPSAAAATPAQTPAVSTPSNGAPAATAPSNGGSAPSNGAPAVTAPSNGGSAPSNGGSVPSNGGSATKSEAPAPVLYPRAPGPTYPLVIGSREISLSQVDEMPATLPPPPQPSESERIAELVAQIRTLKERIAKLEGRLDAVQSRKQSAEVSPMPIVQPAESPTPDVAEARAQALAAYLEAQAAVQTKAPGGGIIAAIRRVFSGLIEVRD